LACSAKIKIIPNGLGFLWNARSRWLQQESARVRQSLCRLGDQPATAVTERMARTIAVVGYSSMARIRTVVVFPFLSG